MSRGKIDPLPDAASIAPGICEMLAFTGMVKGMPHLSGSVALLTNRGTRAAGWGDMPGWSRMPAVARYWHETPYGVPIAAAQRVPAPHSRLAHSNGPHAL